MFTQPIIKQFSRLETPFYYYDLGLLQQTIDAVKKAAPASWHIHYALKANAHPALLRCMRKAGFGADCVSGNEIRRAIECGFSPGSIAFAGVGKSDREISYALEQNIFSFNVESLQELQVINGLAKQHSRKARVALRINPNVDAHTHKYITTGLEENKFGINPHEFETVLGQLREAEFLEFTGLHFHVGSQITDLSVFKNLCLRVNEINRWFAQKQMPAQHINLGGGLGVNYRDPDGQAVVDFEGYFTVFRRFLELQPQQQVHFEPGRAMVAQCGSLISRVLYIKEGVNTSFAILDAGMTELIRPALYQAYHKIENLSKHRLPLSKKYDVVGPVCESSDCFGKAVQLPETERGDLIAIRSAGAYGEAMSSRYNLRDEVITLLSTEVTGN